MTVEAQLFDGTILEFPDGTDPGIIQSKAKEMTLARQPKAEMTSMRVVHEPAAAPPATGPLASLGAGDVEGVLQNLMDKGVSAVGRGAQKVATGGYDAAQRGLDVAAKPMAQGLEFVGSALSRLLPFPGVAKAISQPTAPPGDMAELVNPVPRAVSDLFQSGMGAAKQYLPHDAAKLIEDSMNALPSYPKGFFTPVRNAPGAVRAGRGAIAERVAPAAAVVDEIPPTVVEAAPVRPPPKTLREVLAEEQAAKVEASVAPKPDIFDEIAPPPRVEAVPPRIEPETKPPIIPETPVVERVLPETKPEPSVTGVIAELNAKKAAREAAEEPRGVKDILESESGAVRLGPLRMKDGQPVEAPTVKEAQEAVSALRLSAGNYVEESSKTLKKTMGPEGGELADKAKAVRDDAELEAGMANKPIKDLVNALSKKEATNLVDVIENRAGPISSKVGQAASHIKTELAKIADRAEEVGLKIKNPVTGEKTPWQPRKDFFPHMFEKELSVYAATPDGKAKIKESIKKQMPDATDAQVQKRFEDIIKASRTRYGHLEMARVIDRDDYLKDPKVLLKYITDSYKRLHIAEKFGPDLEHGEKLLTKIGLSKGDDAESFARTYFQRVTDTEPEGNRTVKKFSQFARNFNAFSKLGQAVISNVSQPIYTAVYSGAGKTARGLAASMTKEGRVFGEKILNDSVRDFLKESNLKDETLMGKAADKVLKYTGFTAVEKNNRIIAANTGKYMAQDMFDKLQKHPNNAKYREGLEKLRVDVDGALKNGKLSEMDELRAGQTVVNKTQFKVDVTELPLEWQNDAIKLIVQFKTFQFKAAQFVKDDIIKEIGKGNVMPFVRMAALFPVAGFGIMKAKDAVRLGPQREQKENIADYLAAVGTFGAFTDAFASSGRQPVKGLQQLAGPTLGEAGALWEAGSALTREGNAKPLAKFVAKNIPVVGPSLRNLFNESKTNEGRGRGRTERRGREARQ